MNDLTRLKVSLYQYLMFKGDRLTDDAKHATDYLKKTKYLTSTEFHQIHKALIAKEIFDTIEKDIDNMLKLF